MKVRKNFPFAPWRISISSGENQINSRLVQVLEGIPRRDVLV